MVKIQRIPGPKEPAELTYYTLYNGKPLLGTAAAKILSTVDSQRMALTLGYVIQVQADRKSSLKNSILKSLFYYVFSLSLWKYWGEMMGASPYHTEKHPITEHYGTIIIIFTKKTTWLLKILFRHKSEKWSWKELFVHMGSFQIQDMIVLVRIMWPKIIHSWKVKRFQISLSRASSVTEWFWTQVSLFFFFLGSPI